MLKTCAILLFALQLGGCATGYQDATNPLLGWAGGYWDLKGPGKLTKVGFSGNGYIKREKVGEFLLLRCAEVAKREGMSHFVIFNHLPAAIKDQRVKQDEINDIGTFSTVGGKPSAFVYILAQPESANDALNADELIKRLKPKNKGAKS